MTKLQVNLSNMNSKPVHASIPPQRLEVNEMFMNLTIYEMFMNSTIYEMFMSHSWVHIFALSVCVYMTAPV